MQRPVVVKGMLVFSGHHRIKALLKLSFGNKITAFDANTNEFVEVYPETLRSWYIGDLSGDEIDVQEA